MSGRGVDNTFRRKWDVKEYEEKARERDRQERERESEKAAPSRHRPGLVPQRDFLKPRESAPDLSSRIGRTQVAASATAVASTTPGFYCDICDCTLKDNINYLTHINGKKHQRAMGMSMRIERVGVDEVRARFDSLKRKQLEAKPLTTDDFEARLAKQIEEEERRKRAKREKKKEKDKRAQEDTRAGDDEHSGAAGDPDADEMAKLMGFGGFGSSKQR